MKYNSWDWEGYSTLEKATQYANALFRMGYSLQYIDTQLCCISNLSVTSIKKITDKFVN